MGNLMFQCDVYFCEYFNSSNTSSLKANIYSSGRSCNQISIYMQKWHSSICYPFPKETKIFVIKDSIRDPMKLIEHIKHMNEKKKKKKNMKTKKRGEQRLQDFLFSRWAQALIRKKMRIGKKKKKIHEVSSSTVTICRRGIIMIISHLKRNRIFRGRNKQDLHGNTITWKADPAFTSWEKERRNLSVHWSPFVEMTVRKRGSQCCLLKRVRSRDCCGRCA